jgi:hypothetical protein
MADHLNGLLSRSFGSAENVPSTSAPPNVAPGMRQMLATRPDLVKELHEMGWVPPAGGAGATTLVNGELGQQASTQPSTSNSEVSEF